MAKRKKKDKETIDMRDFKPRNEHLNDVLMSRPAGRMKDKDTLSRSQEKQKLKQGNWESL